VLEHTYEHIDYLSLHVYYGLKENNLGNSAWVSADSVSQVPAGGMFDSCRALASARM